MGTLILPAGRVLTITADGLSTGTYRRFDPQAVTAYTVTSISASSSTVVGPFSQDRNYEVLSDRGALSYTITAFDTDPTGTGAYVRATAPTITAPLGTNPITLASADGAVTIANGAVVATKAGVCAMTLAAPTAAQAGTIMEFIAGTANAHTLTATGLIDDGVTGGSKNLATFGAFVGASLTLMAYNLKWVVLSKNVCTIS